MLLSTNERQSLDRIDQSQVWYLLGQLLTFAQRVEGTLSVTMKLLDNRSGHRSNNVTFTSSESNCYYPLD